MTRKGEWSSERRTRVRPEGLRIRSFHPSRRMPSGGKNARRATAQVPPLFDVPKCQFPANETPVEDGRVGGVLFIFSLSSHGGYKSGLRLGRNIECITQHICIIPHISFNPIPSIIELIVSISSISLRALSTFPSSPSILLNHLRFIKLSDLKSVTSQKEKASQPRN